MEFEKIGYKSHKIIRLYAKVINESCSANRGSIWAIKHFGINLSQKNAFLWPNKAL